jgi:hypothetical protein
VKRIGALFIFAVLVAIAPRFSVIVLLCVASSFVDALLNFTAECIRRALRLPTDDRLGKCPTCRYSLKGVRIRCPECGKLIPPGVKHFQSA